MINSVSVLESLPTGEPKTGKALADALTAEGRKVYYTFADTPALFLQAIQNTEALSRLHGERVALHIEAHGSDKGFHLADGAFVPWHTVKADIQRINVAQKNHLLVSMAVCRGFWLSEIINPTDTSPFSALVASENTVYVAGIQRGFPAFYRSVLSGATLSDALFELNIQQNGLNPDYRLVSSEQMFIKAYRHYVTQRSSPQFLLRRANAVFDVLRDGGILPEALRDKVCSAVVAHIKKEQEPKFEEFRETFFMHGVYPENMAEFCPTYEQLFVEEAQ